MELDPSVNGEYKLCFDNLDGNSKILSFDIIEPLEANTQYANQGNIRYILVMKFTFSWR
jgi:hypothetical protein